MKSPKLILTELSILVSGLFFLLPAAKADSDALTNFLGTIVGYVNGGVGFSFTPATNLAVTRIGYHYYSGQSLPTIKFWASTNYPMATFQLAAGTVDGSMVYSNVSLTLLSNQSYAITLQEGPTFTNTVLLSAYDANTVNFKVNTQLKNYLGFTINTNGVFNGFNTNACYLGPNFSFQAPAAPLVQPRLTITRSNATTVVVGWQASPAGFVLIQAPSLTATNWTLATNVINVVNSTNRVIASPLTTNRFYRLIHP
jgi:hypothetical protein